MISLRTASHLMLSILKQQCKTYARGSPRLSRIPKNRAPNAGIIGQLKMQKNAAEHELEIYEDIDDLEGDFFQAQKAHRQHEKEEKNHAESIKYHIVKQKYFKSTNQYSFLTWSEKAQIRDLHEKDPIEWSIESLAECFPATEETITKIVKTKWEPKNDKELRRHDENVKESWMLYKDNKIPNLEPELEEHLKKFSNRNFDTLSNRTSHESNAIKAFKFPEPKSKEFSHLITSCKKSYAIEKNVVKPKMLEESKESIQLIESHHLIESSTMEKARAFKEDTFVIGNIESKKYEKFEDIKKKLNTEMKNIEIKDNATSIRFSNRNTNDEFNKKLNDNEANKMAIATSNIDNSVIHLDEVNFSKNIEKYETKTVPTKAYFTKNPIQVDQIRDNIYIPRKLYKKGKTYKLYDCFYDDHGEFLYRVPGLSG